MLARRAPGPVFLTIGHSNRRLEDFLELLKASRVECVVDVRKMTRSRANPQFNESTLPAALAEEGMGYEHLAALGGLRGKAAAGVPGVLNGNWRNASFHRYADYALSDAFRQGLRQLLSEGQRRRCAIMCAEALWWRCHRRIVADYLIASGCEVRHIMGAGRVEEARLTEGAVVREDLSVVYPPHDAGGGEPHDESKIA
ncbi:DUF488 domain-containing protein [Diaphorobacter ruginosibacter]|uniref:DUF488 domain-containing protein n=1 Tax=Diaphorobacter ruginosibacter TaxID=1715720 RepID=UPI00333E6136